MTKEDELVEALGEEAKVREAEDDRWWSAVEDGDASALPSQDPAHLDALRPLDDAEMDGIAAFLTAAPAAPGDAPKEAAAPAEVIPISAARRWMAPLGLTIVAAAAVAVFMFRPADDVGGRLPSYSLEVRSGEKPTRGPDDPKPQAGVTLYSDGAIFDFVLVPDAALGAKAEVAMRAVIVTEGGSAKPWNAPSERLDGGTLRVRGEVGRDLELGAGAYDLVFFVGAPARLPTDLTTAAAQAPPDGVQRFVAPIEIR